VNTHAARYQNLSINQTKLSGQCGRLKCCLNFELDTYVDALQHFPNDCDQLELARGRAYLVKKDIFRNLMWYTLPESTKQYPLSIETVKRIKAQNKEGIRPEELETVEVVSSKPKEVEPEYADLVGQISLRSLERTTRRRREKEKGKQQPQPDQRQGSNQPPRGGGGPTGGNRPQQQQRQPNPGGAKPTGNQPRPGGGRTGRNRPSGGGGRPNNPGGEKK
jgi:hypothetical protein